MKKGLLLLSALLFIASCGDKKSGNTEEENVARAVHSIEKNYVDTVTLRLMDFKKQIGTNGKVRSAKKSDLRFLSSGEIVTINVQNGQRVKEGDVLARLNPHTAKIRLEQAELAFEKSNIDLLDKLLGFGYSSDTASVPKEALNMAKISSGYNTSKKSLELARLDFENNELRAPFSGVVANLKAREYETASDVFCSIIDDSSFDVEFSILESEMPFLERGQSIVVTPFVGNASPINGVVTQINPVIDKDGQISIKGSVKNVDNKLVEGMNVKIFIERNIPNQMVVPKSSVVIRDNQNVLFRYNPSTKKAMWTYVDVIMSNSEYHIVAPNEVKNAQLNLGDFIIYTGNLNLADNSNVEIK